MRSKFALMLGVLTLGCLAQPARAQAPAVQGILFEIGKDENTPTGHITVVAGGKSIKLLVVEGTKFETVRGNERRASNFLGEHRGERVAVFTVANSNPPTAALVEILLPGLPPPPPLHIVRTAPRPGHVHGTVVAVNNSAVAIRLHEPPPPILGVVTDVAFNQDQEFGTMTMNVNNKAMTFVVTKGTRFHKLKGKEIVGSNFLAEDRGQAVVVFPMPHHPKVAAKVDIILDGAAIALHHHRYHHHHHWVTFLFAPDTTFSRVRDGKHHEAKISALALGEEVSILPTGIHSHIAKNVEVRLPHAVHGVLTGLAPGGVKVRVHHGATAKHPAEDKEFVIGTVQATTIETIDNKKVIKPATMAALHVGEKVTVFPAGPPPHVAETIAIHVQPAKAINAHGKVVSVGQGAIVIAVHHAATKDGKPAHDEQLTFAFGPATKIELHQGKAVEPGTLAALTPGHDVTIHGHTGPPSLAERIEVKVAPPKKEKPKK